MARKTGQTQHSLAEILAQAKDYDFFQVLHLINMFYRDQVMLDFKSANAVNFSHQIIEKVVLTAENHLTIYIHIFNLLGANSVMPAHYTTLLKKAIATKDHVLQSFLDIFLKRLIDYLYQAWISGRQIMAYKQFGLETLLIAFLGGEQAISDDRKFTHAKLYYSGLFLKNTKPSTVLADLLTDFFHVKISIDNFICKKITVDQAVCSRLSSNDTYNQLGINCNLGDIYWDTQRFFKVIVGPISYQQLISVLPSTEKLFLMQKLIRDYIGHQYDFELVIQLDQTAIPTVKLTAKKALYQLGWNSWLAAKHNESLERNIAIYEIPQCMN